jgi:hypothetical protein
LRKRLALCFMFALGSLYIPPLSTTFGQQY